MSKINIMNCIVYLARKERSHVTKIRALLINEKYDYTCNLRDILYTCSLIHLLTKMARSQLHIASPLLR